MKRLAVLVVIVVVLLLAGWFTGARAWLTKENLQQVVTTAGWFGVVVFFAAFTAGQLLQVPGAVFIIAARAAWGPTWGFAGASTGAVISATLVFLFVRAVGGKPLGEIKWAFARKVLAGLERRPVLTIAVLRAVLMLAPPLNYALALSPVRRDHHLVGSMIGLIVPVAITVCLSEGVLALVRSMS